MKITKTKTETVVEGKHIRLRVATLADGNACVEIDARGARGWVAVLASERSTASLHERTQSLGPVMRTRHRLVEFPRKLVSAEAKGGVAEVVLAGKSGGSEAVERLTFDDDDSHVNVKTTVKLGGPARVAALGTAYIFVPDGMLFSQYEPLDFCWIPHLRREPDHVIGDQIFRSPAVIYQTGKIMAALVPDLDVLSKRRAMPTALDARIDNPAAGAPAFWYGFCSYKNDGHLFFRQSPPGREPLKGELVYACDLLVGARTPERHAQRAVAAHLWRRYGERLIGAEAPQTIPFEDYARRAYGYAFERGRIWREFEIDGAAVGGTIVQTFAGPAVPALLKKAEIEGFLKMQKIIPRLHGIATEKLLSTTVANDVVEQYMHNAPKTIPPLIMNIAWFNNMRTAYGAYAYGEALKDENIKGRAIKMKELALRAPGEAGLMRSCCYSPEDGEPIWIQGTKAFEAVREYHLPDSAWTGWWMLRWHEELEKDGRLLERAKQFGGAFRALQQESGAIPGWARVRSGGLIPHAKMIESAQTAAPGMFLARLARVAGHKPSLVAAERAARFMIEKVFPENKWWDFETFFSCSKKDFGMRDAGTGLHCMNNLCMFWTAEMMRELYEETGKATYLEHGLRALDLMLMWQQVWDAPYVSINTFGGFGVMNTDGEWNDARQSMFAESLMAYYELTGEREYFERGVAALRASFTTMLTPANKAVAPGNMGKYIEKDEGATFENFAHMGYDRRAPGYIMFDWGSGGACSAAARLTRRYGEIYVDAARGHGFGLDLCTVKKLTIGAGTVSLDIETGSKKTAFCVKIEGLSSGRYKLSANGRQQGTHSAAELKNGVVVTV
ncbi:MAG: hypothetical protein WCX65_06340 [bacterium]